MLVVIGTDCTGSCKSNYHRITTTTAHYDMYVKTEIIIYNYMNVYPCKMKIFILVKIFITLDNYLVIF